MVMPMSVLDCDQTKCRSLTDWANSRAIAYEMDLIDANIEQATEIINHGRRRLAQWELAKEAKTRQQ